MTETTLLWILGLGFGGIGSLIAGLTTLILYLHRYTNQRFDKIENRLTAIEDRLCKIEERISRLEERVSNLENRINKIELRLDKMDEKLNDMDRRLCRIEGIFTHYDFRVIQGRKTEEEG